MKLLSKHIILFLFIISWGCSQNIDNFNVDTSNGIIGNVTQSFFQFNGYTNHWQNVYNQQYRYGNLYRINMPDLERSILQSKINIAEALGIMGLQMQEGFFNGLMTSTYTILNNPSIDELQNSLNSTDNLLVFTDPTSETGKKLQQKNTHAQFDLNSHQTKDENYSIVEAFILKNRKKTLYVVLGSSQEQLEQLKIIIADTEHILRNYDLKRGWFGAETLIKSVTCTPGNPIDVIGKGMNEGNSWFVFSGYMEFLAKEMIADWVKEVDLPIVTDVGYSTVFGCDDYDGLQVQSMFERDSWLKFARSKNGYLFRNVATQGGGRGGNSNTEELDFDGYFATEGNASQINHRNKPFVIRTGNLLNGTINSMVLFNKKEDGFNREKMWEAIMDRRAVAVAEGGFIMGADLYRKAMQLLLLDRIYIEEYFKDRVSLNAVTKGHKLYVTVSNLYSHVINGTLIVKLPEQLSLSGNQAISIQLPANTSKDLVFEINPSEKAMDRLNAVVVQYDWDNSSKSTMAALNLPPAISVHQLLYGSSLGLEFPVTIHNITKDESVAVKLTMFDMDNPAKEVFADEQTIQIEKGAFKTLTFDIKQNPGKYIVKTEAMGLAASTQLGIDGSTGNSVSLTEVDLNNDGISEYQMENDHVQVTLLTTGARVIEYIVKAKNDNVFFKLWPDKPTDVDRPFRERAFYPFGGFEDFLGQASVETHKVYDAVVLKRGGEYAQVKMTADYYGNKIEKIFTLYGNSPLVEIRFALNMSNSELNVLGPQPILSLGKEHGVEDKIIIPDVDGLREFVMNPDRMYGMIFFLKEGWNAGYDTIEDISFVGAYPVRRPYYLHMWMNLSSNNDSHYPYVELQPWLPLYQNTTSYFSYYMWAAAGTWKNGLQELRDRNLITTP